MQLAFRPSFGIDPPLPAAGELCLRPQGPERQRRDVTRLVLERGLDAFEQGAEPILVVVLQADPTLDDMLAAALIERLLAGKPLPPGARAFADYAALAREGLKPCSGPLEQSLAGVYLAIRRLAGDDLTDPETAANFTAHWQRLAERLLEAADAGLDPFSAPLLEGATFARERAFLGEDRKVYQQDLLAAERWLVRLPGMEQDAAGLLLRRPRSILWKYWARCDAGAPLGDAGAPLGGAYLFLAVYERERNWRFSTDPVHRLSLRALAEALQQAEATCDRLGATIDPWFDGKPFGYTLVAAPRKGTLLAEKEVLDLVKGWAGVRRIDPPRSLRKRFGLPVASLFSGVFLLALALLLAGAIRKGREVSASLPSGQLTVAVNGQTVAGQLPFTPDDENQPIFSSETDVNLKPGGNEVTFGIYRPVPQLVRLSIRCRCRKGNLGPIRVQVNDEEPNPVGGKEAGTGSLKAGARHDLQAGRAACTIGQASPPLRCRATAERSSRGQKRFRR